MQLVCNWIKSLCFESDFSQEKEELLQQNAELRVKLEAKVGMPSQFQSVCFKPHDDYFYYQKSKQVHEVCDCICCEEQEMIHTLTHTTGCIQSNLC